MEWFRSGKTAEAERSGYRGPAAVFRGQHETQRVIAGWRGCAGPAGFTGAPVDPETGTKCDKSSRKPSPGSFLGDKPPALRFNALLTEAGAERLELVRG